MCEGISYIDWVADHGLMLLLLSDPVRSIWLIIGLHVRSIAHAMRAQFYWLAPPPQHYVWDDVVANSALSHRLKRIIPMLRARWITEPERRG